MLYKQNLTVIIGSIYFTQQNSQEFHYSWYVINRPFFSIAELYSIELINYKHNISHSPVEGYLLSLIKKKFK